jgi:hypothetical protein
LHKAPHPSNHTPPLSSQEANWRATRVDSRLLRMGLGFCLILYFCKMVDVNDFWKFWILKKLAIAGSFIFHSHCEPRKQQQNFWRVKDVSI